MSANWWGGKGGVLPGACCHMCSPHFLGGLIILKHTHLSYRHFVIACFIAKQNKGTFPSSLPILAGFRFRVGPPGVRSSSEIWNKLLGNCLRWRHDTRWCISRLQDIARCCIDLFFRWLFYGESHGKSSEKKKNTGFHGFLPKFQTKINGFLGWNSPKRSSKSDQGCSSFSFELHDLWRRSWGFPSAWDTLVW